MLPLHVLSDAQAAGHRSYGRARLRLDPLYVRVVPEQLQGFAQVLLLALRGPACFVL